MAQVINTNLNEGIFKATDATLTQITNTVFSADLSGCKDPITVISEVPAGAGNIEFVCVNAKEGVKNQTVALKAGALNIFRITTEGYKNGEGFGQFQILVGGTPSANSGVRVAFLKYVSVINH